MYLKRYFSLHDVLVDVKYIFDLFILFFFRVKSEKRIKYDISVVSMIRNEGPYLKEWIEYHLKIGIKHFIIYDNKSTDNCYEILKPYIVSGIVDYRYLNAENMPQRQAYTNAIVKYRKVSKYIAFIDLDEFLVPIFDDDLFKLVDKKFEDNPKMGGLAINWVCYGSSGHQTRPNGGVLESYLMRSKFDYEGNRYIKTIANPRKVLHGGVHFPKYYRGFYNFDSNGKTVTGATNTPCFDYIRINHYASKSIEESQNRVKKGFGKFKHLKHIVHDYNDVRDELMLKYTTKQK